MNKKILVLTAAVMLTGCASVAKQPMDVQTAGAIKEQTIVQTRHEKPTFASITAGKAMLGLLGVAAMASEGNKIVADNNIADPADQIATGLIEALRAQRGAKPGGAAVQVASSDVADIAAAGKTAGRYALDVQTTDWNLAYFPTSYFHYRVSYRAVARLINTETKAVVAQGGCARVPDSSADAPTYDDLLANQATVLKKELALAADACLNSLKSEMLAL